MNRISKSTYTNFITIQNSALSYRIFIALGTDTAYEVCSALTMDKPTVHMSVSSAVGDCPVSTVPARSGYGSWHREAVGRYQLPPNGAVSSSHVRNGAAVTASLPCKQSAGGSGRWAVGGGRWAVGGTAGGDRRHQHWVTTGTNDGRAGRGWRTGRSAGSINQNKHINILPSTRGAKNKVTMGEGHIRGGDVLLGCEKIQLLVRSQVIPRLPICQTLFIAYDAIKE